MGIGFGRAARDQATTLNKGALPPVIRPDVGRNYLGSHVVNYNTAVAAAHKPVSSTQFINLNPEIAKAYVISPTNQGQRGAIASRESMMFDPRNNPSRSQISQGYTDPIQLFAAPNLWKNAKNTSKAPSQPSLKFVSPFSRNPIPTRMPWDL